MRYAILMKSGGYLSSCSLSFVRGMVYTVKRKESAAIMPRFQAVEILRHVRCHGFKAWLIPA